MTENDNRVVVTGLGMITSIGDSVKECYQNAIDGVSGTKEIKGIPTEGCYAKLASQVETDLSKYEEGPYYNKATKLCLHALEEALKDASLGDFGNDSRVAVIIGNCVAGVDAIESYYTGSKESKYILQMPMSSIANQVASYVHAGGEVTNIANACAAGTMSISYASDLIRAKKADIVICGGTDCFASVPYAGFLALHAIDENRCSPFNHTTGINLGEGSGILILESYEHAKKRNAKAYCEVLGAGISSDAHHITAPRDDGEGQMNAINWALERSGVSPSDIDYVNAHGTGTHKNDYAEFLSLRTIFGTDNKNLCVSSTKPMVGHCLGAAGSIEAIFAIMALNHGIIPPTLGFAEEDFPQLKENAGEIDFVPNVAKKKELTYVMDNSFAFGGNNVSLILSSKEGKLTPRGPKKEIAITGFGLVTPLGKGIESYIEQYRNGVTVTEGNVHSEVGPSDMQAANIPMSVYRKWDVISQIETLSGVLALRHAAIEVNEENATKIGIVDGTAEGALGMGCLFEENIAEKGNGAGSAFKFPNTVYNAAAGYLSIFAGIKGYNVTICNGSQSGLDALCYACQIIQDDREEVILASGSDENIPVTSLLADSLHLVSDHYVEPYSCEEGYVLSDGGVSVIVESLEHAKKRNAKVYACLAGYGNAHHGVPFGSLSGSGEGLDEAIRLALEDASLSINDISAISGFGNGLKEVDEVEIESYRRLFGERLSSLPIINSRRRIGEARAAASMLGAVDAALLLSDVVEEDKNAYLLTDSGVKKTSVHSKDLKYVLVTSYSSGGSYTAVILRRAE